MKEMGKRSGGDILQMGIVSLIFYFSSISIFPEMMPISKTFWQKIIAGVFVSSVSGASILTMYFFVHEYVEEHGEELLFNVLFAACGITFAMYFAFQRIIDATGLYFLSVWAPIIGYFAVAVIIAVLLHKYWTLPYLPRNVEEAARAGFIEDVIDCWIRELTPPCGEENRNAETKRPNGVIVNN